MRLILKSLPAPRFLLVSLIVLLLFQFGVAPVFSADKKEKPAAAKEDQEATDGMTLRKVLDDAGWIGIVIIALSVGMVALIIEHLISFRRKVMMPTGLAEQAHQLIMQGRFKQAHQACQQRSSFLGHVLSAGLAEVGLGYSAVEKSMEDASTEQSARLFRKIEYLSVIGTLAPMIGLLGTVWGLMLAFQEFELQDNPHIKDLAPGIRKAMVTTLMGLMVAVPALASFAFFRNRIDELVAESSLMAEHVFADFKRSLAKRRAPAGAAREKGAAPPAAAARTPSSPASPPAEKTQ